MVSFDFQVKPIIAAVCVTVFGVAGATGQAEPTRTMPGQVPDVVGRLRALSNIPAQTQLRLAVGLPLRHKEALTNLIEDLYNPASPRFYRYLTTAQFTEQFGPTEEDYQKVMDYLASHGLKAAGTYPNRMVVDVVGNAADVEKAFHVRLRVYRHPTEERNFFAPDTEPWVEADVPVLDVMGLDDYILPHPKDLKRIKAGSQNGTSVTNRAESGSGPGGDYIGNDFRAAYVPGVTNTGTGQYIGLVEFGAYWTNDIYVYETNAKLSTNIVVSNIFLDGVTEPPASGTDAGEQALDIEMCISMAPGATVLYYGGEIVDDIYSRIASDNLAKQISCSFGFGIDSTTEQLYQEFVAQGQNFFEASGDSGAVVGPDGPPNAEPYVTEVGGTALYTVTPGGAWQQELVWPGSSGGVSTFYAMPNYQQGIDMAPLYGSSTMRNFPDVAMMADIVIFIAANNVTGTVGGTSCSSPQWAGFYALANQQAAMLGQPPLGFFNPALYALGKSTNYTHCLHDITSGNTTNSASGPDKFFAAVGYDLCTGWGSPTGSNLINALTGMGASNFMLYANPSALSLIVGGADEILLNAQPMNGFSGEVSLSVSNLPSGVTAAFNPASISGTGTTILTLMADSTASAGTSTVTLIGASGSIKQTNGLTLAVTGATPGTSQLSLSSAFNCIAIYTDGSTFSHGGGADGDGNAYSANLLGSALNWDGCVFTLGSANADDAIVC
jgi:subtilase family serine protease